LFQPPLSQGLLWYKVYIYSKSIPHKIGTNLGPKNMFCFISCAKSATEYIHSAIDFFRMNQAKKLSQIRPLSPENRPIFCFHNSNFFNFESLSQHIWNVTSSHMPTHLNTANLSASTSSLFHLTITLNLKLHFDKP